MYIEGGSIVQETGVSFLTTWQTFYVITGSAAATLTGLMFVVISLIVGSRARVSPGSGGIATFSTPTVVHFGAVLLMGGHSVLAADRSTHGASEHSCGLLLHV